MFGSLFRQRKPGSAQTAKERLQIILAHERGGRSKADFLPALQRELIAVISKYVSINPEDIKVHLERQDDLEVLEVVDALSGEPSDGAGDLVLTTLGWHGTALLRFQTGVLVGGLETDPCPASGTTA